MSVIRDLVESYFYVQRQQGWRVASSFVVGFLLSPFFEFRRTFLVRRSLVEPIHVPTPKVAVTIRQATLDDLALLKTIASPLRVRRFAKKMQAGEICVVAIHEDRVVGYCLGGFANTPSTRDDQVKLGPKEAYAWGGYVLPEYRRQGVWGAVHLELCRLQQEMGYEGCVGQVDRRNRASQGALKKMGLCVTDRVTLLRVLRWKARWCVPIEEPGRGRVMKRVL